MKNPGFCPQNHSTGTIPIRFRQQFQIKAFCFFRAAIKILLRLIHDSHLQPEFRLSIALMDFDGHSAFALIFPVGQEALTTESGTLLFEHIKQSHSLLLSPARRGEINTSVSAQHGT